MRLPSIPTKNLVCKELYEQSVEIPRTSNNKYLALSNEWNSHRYSRTTAIIHSKIENKGYHDRPIKLGSIYWRVIRIERSLFEYKKINYKLKISKITIH